MNFKEYIKETGQLSKMNVNELYTCDRCHATFRAGDVLLKEAPSNISIAPNPIMGGVLVAEYNGKRYYAHCPKCQQVHLFGFNKGKTEEKTRNKI